MLRAFFITCLFAALSLKSLAAQYYINPGTGKDENTGTRINPLKTLNEAARRVNADKTGMSDEIILQAGIHLVTETVLFNNNKYRSNSRLIIRAEALPDDEDWSPDKMPLVVTIVPLQPGTGGDEARGIQTEVSHVTIAGIRFSGSPDFSYKNAKELRRTYPIWRDGKNLVDLLVTQCLFGGDPDVLPLHVGVIANGHGLVIDHCVFYNCKNPVVFWEAEGKNSRHNAMRYCFVYGCYKSGVWTTASTNGADFEFHHNVIANCKTAWVRDNDSQQKYTIHDCIFSGNEKLAGFETEPGAGVIQNDFLHMNNVQTTGEILIEKDQQKRNYLQLVQGSFGTQLHAGLFSKKYSCL